MPHSNSGFSRYFLALVFTAPVFHQNIHCRQLLLDFFGIRSLLYLILLIANIMANWPPVRADGFTRLWHHCVISGNYNDRHVSRFGARTGTHAVNAS